MKKLLVLTLVMVAAGTLWAGAQTRTLSGVVTAADDHKPIPGVNVLLVGSSQGTVTDANGHYEITVNRKGRLQFSFIGYVAETVEIGISNVINVELKTDVKALSEVIVTGAGISDSMQGKIAGVQGSQGGPRRFKKAERESGNYRMAQPVPEENTETYAGIQELDFHDALKDPLSTFSIDVDAASYSNVRRFIAQGQRPPKDAVRIEEMINYFDYDYVQPKGEDPFSIYLEMAAAPWNRNHQLVHIGLQGKKIATENLPPSNLVFLVDVSGSMQDENKLPLLKASFRLLVDQLREQDQVAMVVYAGAAGVVLESTSGANKEEILDALDRLQAGGSTAGGAGIRLAYEIAKRNFKTGGNNRVILATDGDFNVGESSDGSMEKLITEKRKDGIFLTVLGYGMGNYKDSKMEILADKGNGNYAYIDNILEAQKVLVNEFGGTLFTIAKDVKLQIEFNPAHVQSYRLIGYENRMLKSEDFNNDRKDAGELGSGHTVTALYEIVPVGAEEKLVDPLKYQAVARPEVRSTSSEWMTVKFRYKKPDEDKSRLIVQTLEDKKLKTDQTSDDFRWSAAVAA
ncbi:MAG: von Willebrand factor type A domain-containing protein, partial [Cyclobacteriaceae bacterium]|nr:von Willebrand factor type A domain-containing protein [Cyclobacteriaceae bacterium]